MVYFLFVMILRLKEFFMVSRCDIKLDENKVIEF